MENVMKQIRSTTMAETVITVIHGAVSAMLTRKHPIFVNFGQIFLQTDVDTAQSSLLTSFCTLPDSTRRCDMRASN